MAVERTLSSVTLFGSLDEVDRTRLESECAWRRYRLGERVFDRGSEGRDVYFVIDGGVNIVNFSRSGREVAFAVAKAGDMFGEMAAIDGESRSASVVANEDSLLAILPQEHFIDLLKRRGEITFLLLQRLSTKIRQVGERVMQLSTMEAATRVYAELLRMAQPDETVQDLWVIKPLPPLRVLAGEVSASRAVVSGALNELYSSGLLRRKGESLYFMDRKALEDIVNAAQLDGARI